MVNGFCLELQIESVRELWEKFYEKNSREKRSER
jgi:hypothetical protein